jgi:hypothetical protein
VQTYGHEYDYPLPPVAVLGASVVQAASRLVGLRVQGALAVCVCVCVGALRPAVVVHVHAVQLELKIARLVATQAWELVIVAAMVGGFHPRM